MPVRSDYLEILEDLDREERVGTLRESFTVAENIDPATRAEALPIQKETDLPLDSIERNIEKLRAIKSREEQDLDTMVRMYPKVSKLMENPDNAAILYDQLDILKDLELGTDEVDRTWGEVITDSGIDLSKGVIGFGQSMVGLADIPTFGLTSDLLETIGYRPEETQKILGDLYSKKHKRILSEIQRAEGFTDTAGAYLENPTAIVSALIETSPNLLGIVGASRAAAMRVLHKAGLKAGTKEAAEFLARKDIKKRMVKAATIASAAAEGAIVAGSTMSGAKEKGSTWLESVGPSIAAGLGTALISRYSSKILPDVEATIASQTIASSKQSLLEAGKQISKSMLKEGLLEEMPQSAQEQVWMNLATGKPWNEGVSEAGATGLVVGTAMGGAFSTPTALLSTLSRTTDDIHLHVASTTDQMYLEDVLSFAQENKLKDLSPEKYVEALKGVVGENRKVFIDPEDVETPAPQIEDYITPTGDAEIPLVDFLDMVTRDDELLTTLRPHVRLHSDAYTQTELGDRSIENYAQQMIEQARVSQEALSEAEQMFEEIRDQLVATERQSEMTANLSAQIMPAVAATHAARRGISVQEAYEAMNLRVAKEGQQVDTRTESPTIIEQKLQDRRSAFEAFLKCMD